MFRSIYEKQLHQAINNGDLKILKSLYKDCNVEWDKMYTTNAINLAAYYGNTNIVKFMHETMHVKCTFLAMDLAAENGYLDTVKYLHENQKEICHTKICTLESICNAAKNGHSEIVKFLHKNIFKTGSNASVIDIANATKNQELIDYFS